MNQSARKQQHNSGFKKMEKKIKVEDIKRMQNLQTNKVAVCKKTKCSTILFFINASLSHSNLPLHSSFPLSLSPSAVTSMLHLSPQIDLIPALSVGATPITSPWLHSYH